MDGKQGHMMKPLSLAPVHKSSVIDIESSMSSSENTMAMVVSSKGDVEHDTGDSETVRASKVCLINIYLISLHFCSSRKLLFLKTKHMMAM